MKAFVDSVSRIHKCFHLIWYTETLMSNQPYQTLQKTFKEMKGKKTHKEGLLPAKEYKLRKHSKTTARALGNGFSWPNSYTSIRSLRLYYSFPLLKSHYALGNKVIKSYSTIWTSNGQIWVWQKPGECYLLECTMYCKKFCGGAIFFFKLRLTP